MPLDGQWPPVHASDYVPLILSLSDFGSEKELTSKINKILKGNVEDVSVNLLNFEDIFNVDSNGSEESINTILVQGSPGIGKTAFSLTLCKNWASGKLFTQFKIVLLWALRDPAIESFTSVDDLFVHDSSEISKAVVSQIKQNGGKGVLFVFDGWDELPDKFKSRSSCFFLKLIEGNELPFSSVVVTSRNISSQKLLRQNLFQRSIDILGFSNACIEEYIHKCFIKSPSNEKKLLKLLSERPDIQSICYVPMNCSIVCYVFSCKQALPLTLTEFYELLAKNSLIRNADLRGTDCDGLVDFDFNHLPVEINNLYLSLCKLSYHGLSVNRYTYSRNDVASVCEASTSVVIDVDKLGVLQAVNVFHTEGVSSSFHFLHTTVQEFMAANYIVSLSQEDLKTVVNAHFSHHSFEMVWQFYCGLLATGERGSKNIFIERLQVDARNAADIDSGFHDHFSYCSSDEEIYFSESDSDIESLTDQIESETLESPPAKPSSTHSGQTAHAECPDDVMPSTTFGLSKIPECDPLDSVVDQSPSPSHCPEEPPPTTIQVEPPSTKFSVVSTANSDDYNMTGSNILITAGGLQGVSPILSNVTAVLFAKVDPYRMDKLQVLFTLRCIYEAQNHLLCSSLSSILSSRLFFNKQTLSPADVNAIGFIIARSNHKWQLRLVNCDLSVNHLIMLCHHFRKSGSTGKLTRLYLNNNGLDCTSAEQLVKMLPAFKPLQKLCLGSNSFGDKSFEIGTIPQLIKGLRVLSTLDLASNNISDSGVQLLADCLTHHKHLTHLDLANNSISSKGAAIIACVVSSTSLQYLGVGGNPLNDDGIQNLSPSICNSSLKFLNVSDTGLSDEGAVILASALQCNSCMETLIMHSNNQITSEGLGLFLDMCVSSKLTTIDISYCQVGCSTDLLCSIATNIQAFETLRSLDFAYNDLEDEGISALINATSCTSHITKLALGGNGMSTDSLQLLGFAFCENKVLKKVCLCEDDLFYATEEFEVFCDCLVASSSLQVIELHEVENEQVLRQKFKQVNNQRKALDKNLIKFIYQCSESDEA